MTEQEANEIIIADALRYAARTRRENLELQTYRTPRPSRDNSMAHDGHVPNTFRRFPRTSYSNPEKLEGTSPSMRVTLPSGETHTVPAVPGWRKYATRKVIVVKDTMPETARRGGSQGDYD